MICWAETNDVIFWWPEQSEKKTWNQDHQMMSDADHVHRHTHIHNHNVTYVGASSRWPSMSRQTPSFCTKQILTRWFQIFSSRGNDLFLNGLVQPPTGWACPTFGETDVAGDVLMNVLVRGPLETGDPMVALRKRCLASFCHSTTRYDLDMYIDILIYILYIFKIDR